MQQPTGRRGNAFLFYLALLLVITCVGAGIYFLIPNITHPLTSDAPNATYGHIRPALIAFVLAILALFIARATRPRSDNSAS